MEEEQKRIWTDEQVKNLNDWQNCGFVHPFTWHNSEGVNTGAMIATPYGWVAQEGGEVVQDWAHEFMLDGEYVKQMTETYRKMDTRKWVKPEMQDDWGHKYLLAKHREESTCSYDRDERSVIHPGERLEVQWPDGTQEIVTLHGKTFTDDVSDMGRTYPVTYSLPMVMIKHNGANVCVPLHETGCLVREKNYNA